MKTIDTWFAEYGKSHRNPINKKIHFICVPRIMLSLIGLLWSIPVPAALEALPIPLNWAVLFLLLALGYYSALSRSLTVGMVLVAVGLAGASYGLDRIGDPTLWQISAAIFAGAWISPVRRAQDRGRASLVSQGSPVPDDRAALDSRQHLPAPRDQVLKCAPLEKPAGRKTQAQR